MPLEDLYLGDALATVLYHLPTGEEATPYVWDPKAMRYVHADTGSVLDPLEVRSALSSVITAVQRQLDSLAEAAVQGEMDPIEWRASMEGQITVLHQVAAMAATGGLAAQDVKALRVMTERIQSELAYLDGFAEDLIRARLSQHFPTLPATERRADQYAQAALPTYEEFRHRLVMEDPDAQYDVARRVLMPQADHCDPCVAIGVMPGEPGGYVAVRDVVPIGVTPCRSNCECTIEYARSETLRPGEYTL